MGGEGAGGCGHALAAFKYSWAALCLRPLRPLGLALKKTLNCYMGFCMPKKTVERTRNFQPIEMCRDAEPHTKDDKQHTSLKRHDRHR